MRLLIVTIGLGLAASSTAAAERIETFQVGNWRGGAYTNNDTRQFSHCAVNASYRSGIILLFSVGRTYHWSMALANQRWSLNKGAVYDVAYDIDGGPRTTVKGRANTSTLVEIPLADSATLFRAFQSGKKLNVHAAGGSFSFRLDDSSRALAATLACARKHMGTTSAQRGGSDPFSGAAASNPFGAGAVPGNKSPNAGERRAEAAAVVANTLSASGITDFRVVPMNEAPAPVRGSDAFWVAPGLAGTLDIVVPPQPMKADEIAAMLVSKDAKKCTGTFTSGRPPAKPGSAAVRVSTMCVEAGKTRQLEYSVATRSSGGYYVHAVTPTDDAAAGTKPQPGAPQPRPNRKVPDLNI
jgi:hypothetical protein